MKYNVSYLFSYLERVGNYDFNELNFNIIDALILANLSYYHFYFMLDKENYELTIKEATHIYFLYPELVKKADIETPRNRLLKVLVRTKRFKDLKIFNFEHEISKKSEKQFCALSVKINQNTIYVSFSGTDLSLIGWKEDFNLSYLDTIPSQISAKNYVNKLKLKGIKNLYLGGHSKGGNLALYASYFSYKRVKSKIVNVFNFDGPGLNIKVNDEITKNKIITIVPSMSIFGMVFNNPLDTYIISSSTKGLLQHDLFSWIIDKNNHFIFATYLSSTSKTLNIAISKYVKDLPKEERKEFINLCYLLIKGTKAEDIIEFRSNLVKTLIGLIKTYNKLNEIEKTTIKKCLRLIIKLVMEESKNFKEEKESREVINIKGESRFDYFKTT